MKIQYASDLHLEFKDNGTYLKDNPIQPIGDILVLSGDIVPFHLIDQHDWFFDYVSANFKFTYLVPGNHEYYYSDISNINFPIIIRDNVRYVNNESIIHDNVRLIFSTLWSNISIQNGLYIQNHMSDFHVIKNNNITLTYDMYNELHKDCLYFISNELRNKFGGIRDIVISHHVPTFMNYPEEYRGSRLNEGFAVELYDLICDIGPMIWIYGHTHGNVDDFVIGERTNLLCNQLGYVKYDEHLGFRNKVIYL